MHEYFLTATDGSVVFEKNDQADRLDFLASELNWNREPINSVIQFEFPDSLKAQYDSYNLKLVPSYSGCKVAVRVIQKKLDDLSVVYDPVVTLPQDLNIFIVIEKKTSLIDRYTNARTRTALPGIYFFFE